ncbi:hypothetical protein DPMN_085450 [Dreissena polymorpha]|uniref:Uncharacterized protein n=1 Tax=Dreissena polymorpha TaxID=45954 RepID=A0A9D3YCR5_DREPO|nr:hypothetical protein DPMN_085450 [Dreissena polymorpha]
MALLEHRRTVTVQGRCEVTKTSASPKIKTVFVVKSRVTRPALKLSKDWAVVTATGK